MTSPVPSSAATAFALSRYTATPAANPADKARAAAEDFEAAFLGTMFNQMFESLQGDGPLGGEGGAGVWRSFLADEYARAFAGSGGIGIADQVYRTLLAHQEASQ